MKWSLFPAPVQQPCASRLVAPPPGGLAPVGCRSEAITLSSARRNSTRLSSEACGVRPGPVGRLLGVVWSGARLARSAWLGSARLASVRLARLGSALLGLARRYATRDAERYCLPPRPRPCRPAQSTEGELPPSPLTPVLWSPH